MIYFNLTYKCIVIMNIKSYHIISICILFKKIIILKAYYKTFSTTMEKNINLLAYNELSIKFSSKHI